MPNVIVTPTDPHRISYILNTAVVTEDIASLFSVSEPLCGGIDLEVTTLDDSSWPLKWIEPDDHLQIYSDDTSLAGQT